MSKNGVVRSVDEAPRHKIEAARSTEMQVLLGPEDGARNFSMRGFIMGEGGGMPRHNNTVEHEQYVLRGRARVTIGEDSFEVAAGTVLLIPEGSRHDYQVIDAPFEFLCLVPNKEDRIEICAE